MMLGLAWRFVCWCQLDWAGVCRERLPGMNSRDGLLWGRRVRAEQAEGLLAEPPNAIYFQCFGAVAQLGERDVRNVEVRGSIPLSSRELSSGASCFGGERPVHFRGHIRSTSPSNDSATAV